MSKDKKQTILVVDDQTENIDIIVALLKSEYQIKVATEGPTALTIAVSKTSPDLILLDIIMPEMDGFEVCRRLKANSKTSHIPVIFLTGQTKASELVKGFELGAVDYVTKPFNGVELVTRVKTHLTIDSLRSQLENRNQALTHELKVTQSL
jgi:PleD family two-component response regulator